jgi:hypothetical protein
MDGEQRDVLSPLTIFYAYAQEDEQLRRKLEKHLSLLRQQGVITQWHDRQVLPGSDWAHVIDTHLMKAQVILLLISPDFLASDYCYGVEMQRALERHGAGEAQVIPILLRPVDWESAPFASLQCLPHNAQPITLWKNEDEALVTVVKGIRAVIEQSHASVTRGSTRHRQPSTPSSVAEDRQHMLRRVRTIWITGMLEHSLYGRVLITLGLREESKVLANPWRLVVREVDHPAQSLPAGTRISEVYDGAGGELLILGEPGSGKTTLLLELARDLLDRAWQCETYPIPVVFSLSSWAVKRQPFADWLVEELNLRYQVQRKLGRSWVKDDQFLLLLDGLDEVPSTARTACVEAINAYRQEHGLRPMVVCSRSADYLALSKKVLLRSAATIQPLTWQQIESYLSSAGEQLAGILVALHEDPVLQELATTPLMLNVLTLAYQGTSVDKIGTAGSLEVQRRQIFSAYIERMLQRRGTQTSYTQQQTIHWLAWLAKKMLQYNQTQFYLEDLQPTWLANPRVRITYQSVVGLLAGLLIGLFPFVIWGILSQWNPSHLLLIVMALPAGLRIGFKRKIDPVEATTWTWRGLRLGLLVGSFVGIAAGILAVYAIWLSHGQVTFGMWSGAPSVEGDDLRPAIVDGIIDAGAIGFVVGLIIVLLRGFSSRKIDEKYRSKPNQGIWRSSRNSGLFASIAFLISTLIFVLFIFLAFLSWSWVSIDGLPASPPPAHVYVDLWVYLMLIIVLILIVATPFVGLSMGGATTIQHLILRLFLWQRKSIPWKYVQFLDYAAERILLRKVGGGYIFVHQLLLEYFALLETMPVPEESPEQ